MSRSLLSKITFTSQPFSLGLTYQTGFASVLFTKLQTKLIVLNTQKLFYSSLSTKHNKPSPSSEYANKRRKKKKGKTNQNLLIKFLAPTSVVVTSHFTGGGNDAL